MALRGKAVMINWSDVPVEHRADYYHWHDREHMRGRIEVPGMQRGRRHLAVDADRDIFNLYEADDLGVFTGGPYTALARSPTALTQRVGKLIVNAVRALAHVRYTAGEGVGAFVHTIRFDATPGREGSLGQHLLDRLPVLLQQPGVFTAHWCVADDAASNVVTPERKGRPTAVPRWSVIVEGTATEAVRQATAAVLTDAGLNEHGAAGPLVRGTYVLQRLLMRDDVG